MTNVHPRFRHQCFASFSKFEHSMERIVNHTFSVVNFDRTQSLLPTYIGVDVVATADEALLKATRRFFEKLRAVHQKHFVRFITDTVWAMESNNGDIFYCHDREKSERCDVVWLVKAISVDRFEVSIINTPDNRRREILTDLQFHLNKLYKADPDEEVGPQLGGIMNMFYSKTKNIRSMEFLKEDCHIVLMPLPCGLLFRPVIVCGVSKNDSLRRWRSIRSQLELQNHNYSRYFPEEYEIVDMLKAPIDLMCQNGELDENDFCTRTHYEAAEQAFSIYDGTKTFDRSEHDVIILHTMPDGNIWTNRSSLDYLTTVN